MKPYRLGKGGNKRWYKFGLFFGLFLITVAVVGYFGIRNFYQNNLKAVDPSATESIVFTLESGATAQQIAASLKEKELIRSTHAFNQYIRSNELAPKFIAGTYRLSQSMDVPTIAGILTDGTVATDLCTVLPGSSLNFIKQHFIEKCGFTASEVESGFNAAQYAGHPALVDLPEGANLEGFLYPDSYELVSGTTTVSTIIRQSLDEMAEALSADIRAGIARQGLSVYDGIKLASIVEKEVGAVGSDGVANDNRAKAAQVFLKRLQLGWSLESNATDGWPDDYNTYQILGLPPSPISNVSKSSLSAVANPASTNYLFFVSGADCVTRFSETLAQHDSLKAQYGIARPETGCRG